MTNASTNKTSLLNYLCSCALRSCTGLKWLGNWPERGPPPSQPRTGSPWTRASAHCASSSSAAPTAQSCSPGWWEPAPAPALQSLPGPGPGPSSWAGAACEAWWWNHSRGRSRRRIPRCESCWGSSARRQTKARKRSCSFLWRPERRGLTHPSPFPHWCFPFLQDKHSVKWESQYNLFWFVWMMPRRKIFTRRHGHKTGCASIIPGADSINKRFTCSVLSQYQYHVRPLY